MKISIIIPVYNVESYITDCLQSVMRQTYQGSLECIIVDDCGTDKSLAIAEKLIADYEGSIEFRVLHHEHNRGLSAARNTGMDAARGEYVYFLDSDDWISDDCIEKLAKPLVQERFDIVVGDYESVGQSTIPMPLALDEGKYFEKGISDTFCNRGVYLMAWNKLYSKDFLLRNNLLFEEGKISEDEIMAFEISCLNKSYYVVKSVTYLHRITENSIINGMNDIKRLDTYLGVFQSVQERMKRFQGLEGIYDFYMFWIKRVIRWISQKVELNEEMLSRVDKQFCGCLDLIPNVFCLRNKSNRLLYMACRNNQSFTRFQYVIQVYTNKLQGRVYRNVLNMLPYRKTL